MSSKKTVLAALSSPSRPAVPPSSAPAPPPSARGGGGLHCDYCGKDGHVEAFCYRKKKAQRSQTRPASQTSLASQPSASTSAGVSQRSSTDSVNQEMLMLLRRLAASSPSGTASVVTLLSGSPGSAAASQSSTQGPPGTNTWILDSGASFHMTPDRTFLSSIQSPSQSLTVHTADGSSLSVAGEVTLLSTSFHVPNVSYVPNLTMQLMSAGQLTDHGCRVILDPDFCYVQDHHTGHLVGTGPRRCDSQRLWELDWLRLPSAASASSDGSALAAWSTSSFAQWHHRLGHLCGSRCLL